MKKIFLVNFRITILTNANKRSIITSLQVRTDAVMKRRGTGSTGGVHMAHLSRADLDNFAEHILYNFVQAEYPKGHMCYNVDPARLAQFYGFNIL